MVTVFSPAETYNLKSQWYADLWDNVLAKAFGEVVEEEKIDGSQYIELAIGKITKEIEKKGIL